MDQKNLKSKCCPSSITIFSPGDIGYYDEHGYVFVVDRLKELIKYNAYQVSPAELEAVILTQPDVVDAGVIGLPDEVAGELPHAWVVRKPGSKVTEQDIVKFVEGNFKHSLDGEVFRDTF